MADMNTKLSDSLGRAVVSYPFMVMALAVIVGIEASDRATGGFLMWTVWALLWLAIAAFVAGLIVLPILAAELLVWSFAEDRITWLRDTWPGAIASSVILGLPWALAPQAALPGALLIALGLVIARIAVPSLRPGRAEAGA